MEQEWSDTDRRKPKESEDIAFQHHFVHHKFHKRKLRENQGFRD
jgi:hypothetical protein